MPEFRLQFPIDRVSEYAGRYSYADDVVVIATGQTARERGYYTFEEFAAVCRWKSQRTVSYVAKNASDCVERATSVRWARPPASASGSASCVDCKGWSGQLRPCSCTSPIPSATRFSISVPCRRSG